MRVIRVVALLTIVIAVHSSVAQAGAFGRAIERAALERVERTVGRRVAGEELAAGERSARPLLNRSQGAAACRAVPNKCAGIRREGFAWRILEERYPSAYIQGETYFRTKNGRIAIDPVTRSGRRVDYSLFSDNKLVKRFEVTSQTADKRGQLAKERRIFDRRANGSLRTGGIYARDRRTEKLVPVTPGQSAVMRFH